MFVRPTSQVAASLCPKYRSNLYLHSIPIAVQAFIISGLYYFHSLTSTQNEGSYIKCKSPLYSSPALTLPVSLSDKGSLGLPLKPYFLPLPISEFVASHQETPLFCAFAFCCPVCLEWGFSSILPNSTHLLRVSLRVLSPGKASPK